jgi:prepilin-type processing-associated H-X9-DG protein
MASDITWAISTAQFGFAGYPIKYVPGDPPYVNGVGAYPSGDPTVWDDGPGAGAPFQKYAPMLSFAYSSDSIQGPNGTWGTTCCFGTYMYMAIRHLGTANCLFADGHVKTQQMQQVYAHGCGDPASEFCNGR